jgi:hypothetical protein
MRRESRASRLDSSEFESRPVRAITEGRKAKGRKAAPEGRPRPGGRPQGRPWSFLCLSRPSDGVRGGDRHQADDPCRGCRAKGWSGWCWQAFSGPGGGLPNGCQADTSFYPGSRASHVEWYIETHVDKVLETVDDKNKLRAVGAVLSAWEAAIDRKERMRDDARAALWKATKQGLPTQKLTRDYIRANRALHGKQWSRRLLSRLSGAHTATEILTSVANGENVARVAARGAVSWKGAKEGVKLAGRFCKGGPAVAGVCGAVFGAAGAFIGEEGINEVIDHVPGSDKAREIYDDWFKYCPAC